MSKSTLSHHHKKNMSTKQKLEDLRSKVHDLSNTIIKTVYVTGHTKNLKAISDYSSLTRAKCDKLIDELLKELPES